MLNKIASSVLALAVTLLPQTAALPEVQSLGPQIGERVPDFTLQDQHGERRSLASLLGPRGLMLVFYRSADW